ncbi:putative methyltransferase [Aspergillus steynii IBT 23096]|uniref:Putative methyltransferase n=1 Tax=Aspergillus steynii IBT 23096 TaxID=1392250 RepID=A0A2I2G3D7_9EURO|nr:putative methyltransferase [Aspergillus steynii IBT 23096]PLB47390.1 putative methyltransferase [Aspergillus steynii IBT 23096]
MTEPNPTSTARFNEEATTWDTNPSVQEATRLAFAALEPIIRHRSTESNTNTGVSVLEIGCGTGLLTTRVAPLVDSIVAIDTAPGMIAMLEAKIAQSPAAANVIPLCKLLVDPEDEVLPAMDRRDPSGPRQKFDLVLSHLVMHHVPDLRAFVGTVFGCLKPGGRVALTDYEDFGPEAIKFHPRAKLEGVERHGIQREWMEGLMREVGFRDVKVQVGWGLEKKVTGWESEEEGRIMVFPFLVCEGVR